MNSACMLTFGYFSMNTSESAFASFSMEVEPAIVMEPLKSAGAASSEASSLPASAVVSAAAASVSAAAAVVAAVVSFALLEQPARLNVKMAAPARAITLFNCLFIIFFLFSFLILFLSFCLLLFYSWSIREKNVM